jgi:membrane fusion protein, type I secretion system
MRGLRTGTILPSDLVWSPGLPEWVLITDIIPPGSLGVSDLPSKVIDGRRRKANGRPALASRMQTLLGSALGSARKAGNVALEYFSRRARSFMTNLRELAENRKNESTVCENASLVSERPGLAADGIRGQIVRLAKAIARLDLPGTGAPNGTVEKRRFDTNGTDWDPDGAIRKLNLVGMTITVILVGGIGGWAATAQLAGAVIAPGTVVVETNVKKVQHPTGGVVGEILVNEGSAVEAGQVLVRLDDTVTKATLGVVRSQLDEFLARQARLLAERDDAGAIAFPAELTDRRNDASVASALTGEEKLFESRRNARAGQRSQLRERVAQTNEEIRGLSAQQAAKETENGLIGKELVGVADLYQKNLVSISRYTQLQRDQSRILGERGQLIADIARARGKVSEIELQIIQLDQDFRTDVLKDLREAQGKVAELRERVTAAEDQLKRVELRAPQAGFVHQLAAHTVGGVIGNGETIMQIVPRADDLVVEAKVAPSDVDQVTPGAKVLVRIMAGNQRTAPDLVGVLARVSADLTREQQTTTGQPAPAYYTVRVSLPADEIARLKDIRLIPGMPAEAFIRTHERTPLEYLLKPLQEQIARTFRER